MPKKITSTLDTAINICKLASEAKGYDISLLNVAKVFQLSEYFIVISARSDRHVQGVANRIIDSLKDEGIKPIATEGLEKAHWVLVDYGEIIVHVFYEEMRSRYDLESLWLDAEKIDLSEIIDESEDKDSFAA